MKKSWPEFFQSKMPNDYESRVLEAAALELKKHAIVAPSSFWQRSRYTWVAGLAASVIAGIFVFGRHEHRHPRGDELDLMSHDAEMLNDLEFFDDFETIENWDGETGD